MLSKPEAYSMYLITSSLVWALFIPTEEPLLDGFIKTGRDNSDSTSNAISWSDNSFSLNLSSI